jgi:arylsulfatase A-like enzyme
LASGVVSDALVELLDMSATVAEAAELGALEQMQGRTLMPILRGEADAGHHRDFVRCEYFDALDTQFTGGGGTFATMYRNRRYKLCNYHTQGLGELYDLQEDPWEHNDLWDSPYHAAVRHELVQASFDAHVLASTDVGSRRIAPM